LIFTEKGLSDSMRTVCAIGQDSHRLVQGTDKPLVLGGVAIEEATYHADANSDGDVVLHALTNAVSGLTCRNILGEVADKMCREGITDSSRYLKVALDDLAARNMRLVHISFTVECRSPKLAGYIESMRQSIAGMCPGMSTDHVGITATSGEGLTSFGRGEGISVFCVITAEVD